MISSATMRGHLGLVSLAVAGVALLLSIPLRAQVAGATLSGTVVDATGAVVANAKLSIKNTGTNIVQEVSSDVSGLYSIPNLLPGTYEVTISAPGFSNEKETGITLGVGELRRLDFSLRVGQISQTIQVTGEPATVDLATSMLSAEVTGETVRELPLNGRDWTQLANLQPGVTTVTTQADQSNVGGRGNRGFGNELSDVGHSPYMNNYRINGISANDYTNGAPGSVLGGQLGVDGIQEFSVQTVNYPAEYGRSAGAVINAITKSGTNDIHGTAFWFLRDDKLDARNFFDPAQIAPFHRNQFGAAAGGPIKKNRTFFFFDYEGVRQDLGLSFHDTVPTASARAGNLCSEPSTSACTPTTITVSPLVAPFLAFWPLPNGGLVPGANGDTGFFNGTGSSPIVENYYTGRVDHKISERDSIAASYTFDKSTQTAPDALLVATYTLLSERQLATLEWNHSFSSGLINSARIGYNRPQEALNEPGTAILAIADDPSFGAIPGKNAPIIGVPGLTTMQGALGALPISLDTMNSFQAYDDVFFTHGTHSIKFGFAVENIRDNVFLIVRQNGDFNFPSLQGFLQNQPSNVMLDDAANTQEMGGRQTAYGLYVQDDWRLRPNLTINVGLRYEPTTLPAEEHDRFQVLESLTGTLVPNNHNWVTNSTLKDFQPRVGFAWDPFHDGKTAVRGGFGLYDMLPLPWSWGVATATAYPFNLIASAGNLPAGSFPTGAASLIPFSLDVAAVRYTDPHPKRAYSMNWNVNIQRQITASTTLSVSYVGTRSYHGPQKEDDTDMVLPTPTAAGYLWPFPVGSGTRLNPNYGAVVPEFWYVASRYEGFLAGVTKKFSHGFQAQASYTYSKCFDNGTIGPATSTFDNSVSSPMYFNPADKNGLCDYDVRDAFVGNYLWRLPTPKFWGAFGENALGGWSVGGVVTLRTGTPFTVYTAGDSLGQNSTDPHNYPDRVQGNGCSNPINPGNANGYLKLNCFTPPIAPSSLLSMCQPAAASVSSVIPNTCMNLFGNNGRNSIIGPGLMNWDFSLIKDSYIRRISESFDVQFRAEFFNILNHTNFQSPLDNNAVFNQDGTSTPGAGVLDDTTTTSRQIQFGLKLIW